MTNFRPQNEFHVIGFRGDKILTVKDNATGKGYADIRSICKALGLDYTEEVKKLKTSPEFANGLKSFNISQFN